MHRFLGASATTSGFGISSTVGRCGRLESFSALMTGLSFVVGGFPMTNGASFMYVVVGYGGLGVVVRAGLVIPPSLVRSAVDAALAILMIDLRRARSVAKRISGLGASVGLARWKALVSSDSLRSC